MDAAGMTQTRSAALFERMAGLLPGGNTRATTWYPPFPVALAGGHGARVVDVDGNEYLDFLANYTAMVHGHGFPPIVEALERTARNGWSFPAPSEDQAELAARICARFGAIERVRFTNSGTEAVMVAVRAARAFTGRDVIVKAFGGYHGCWEQVAAGAGEDPDARAELEPGIPAVVADLVLQVPYDDAGALAATMAEHGDRVAAILLEPVLGHSIEPASPEYLHAARRIADAHGALLILDEVITARLHTGGRQTQLGVTPDLTTLGKVIGGGVPIGGVGGRAEVMDVFDPRRDRFVEHHGTFNGNGLAMAAGCASLDALPAAEIDRIDLLGARLADGLTAALADAALPGRVTRVGSLLHVHLPLPELRALHAAALREGLYMAPRGQMSISTPMDDELVDAGIAAFARAAQHVQHATGSPAP